MEQRFCIANFGWTIHRNVTQLARGNCVAGSSPAVPIGNVAQQAEHPAVNRVVIGSNPIISACIN